MDRSWTRVGNNLSAYLGTTFTELYRLLKLLTHPPALRGFYTQVGT